MNTEYINFTEKMKSLHTEICKAIANLMLNNNVRELNVLTDIRIENKFTGDIQEDEVTKICLNDDNEVIALTDYDDEINILHNQYIVPCSIIDLYEQAYMELEGNK